MDRNVRQRVTTKARRAVAAALLLPLLLLSAVAAGTMPARALDGTVEIVICTGDAFVTMRVPAEDAPPGETPASDDPSCPWADAATPALAQVSDPTPLPPSGLHAARFVPPARDSDIRVLTRRVSNRGPPRPS